MLRTSLISDALRYAYIIRKIADNISAILIMRLIAIIVTKSVLVLINAVPRFDQSSFGKSRFLEANKVIIF